MKSENQENSDNKESFSGKDFEQSKLILYNDDVNSFDFVITNLINICKFEDLRAEQLALIAHYTGKSTIKIGEKNTLAALKFQFEEAGLHVEII
ncbi:ATP-dependent Clp protease adaptor ClpS [Bacteroidota bacterium]